GWYRSNLIDQFVRHLSQWWLIGTSYTANWANGGPVLAVDPNNVDITNQYIAQGITAGIWGVGLFLAIIILSFRVVGRTVRLNGPKSATSKLSWTMGVALAAHCTAFISISYFDQIVVFWFWLIAGVVAVSSCLQVSQQSAASEPN